MAAADEAGVIVVRAEEGGARMRDVDSDGGNAGFDVLGCDCGLGLPFTRKYSWTTAWISCTIAA